jgi:hypothetical protein
MRGQTNWEFGCTYNYNKCKCKNIWSTDPRLLYSVDDWMMQSFPVEPKFVDKPSFYMLNSSKMLEKAMLTQASADWLSAVLYKSQNEFNKILKHRTTRVNLLG